jgi:hypothetical protein
MFAMHLTMSAILFAVVLQNQGVRTNGASVNNIFNVFFKGGVSRSSFSEAPNEFVLRCSLKDSDNYLVLIIEKGEKNNLNQHNTT